MTHESDAGRSDAGGSGAGGSWWDNTRGVIAFGVAPLAAPLMVYLLAHADIWSSREINMFVGIALPFSYIGTVVFGLPLYLLLRKCRLTGFGWAATVGFVIGLAAVYLLDALFVASLGYDAAGIGAQLKRPEIFAWAVMYGGLSGIAVGAALWLIARPDRRTQ